MMIAMHRQHSQRVPEIPHYADTGSRTETALWADDGGHRDYVIRIGRVTHSEQQSQESNSKRYTPS